MLEILEYATSGFWIFLGCASLLSIVPITILAIGKAIYYAAMGARGIELEFEE